MGAPRRKSTGPEPPRVASVAGLLGINLWAVTLAVPLWLEPRDGLLALPALLGPLALFGLGLGVGMAARPRRPGLGRGLLLVAFPLGIGLGMATLGLGLGADRSAAGALLEGLSFVAYLVAVTSALAQGAERLEAKPAPAAQAKHLGAGAGSLLRRRAIYLVCVAAALGLAVVAPAWDSAEARAVAFGPNRDAAAVLTTVVGALLGLLLLGGYLAPSTRSMRRGAKRGAGSRAAIYLLVAAVGAALFAVAGL